MSLRAATGNSSREELSSTCLPPRSRSQRLPAACDTPTATAASSVVSPLGDLTPKTTAPPHAAATAGEHRRVESVESHLGAHAHRSAPAQDGAGVDADDERDLDHADPMSRSFSLYSPAGSSAGKPHQHAHRPRARHVGDDDLDSPQRSNHQPAPGWCMTQTPAPKAYSIGGRNIRVLE